MRIVCICWLLLSSTFFFFFFNDTATTEIYTLSLHDALPICSRSRFLMRTAMRRRSVSSLVSPGPRRVPIPPPIRDISTPDRKSTRLNSSHDQISYAVFCLKKKKITVTDSEAFCRHGDTRAQH